MRRSSLGRKTIDIMSINAGLVEGRVTYNADHSLGCDTCEHEGEGV